MRSDIVGNSLRRRSSSWASSWSSPRWVSRQKVRWNGASLDLERRVGALDGGVPRPSPTFPEPVPPPQPASSPLSPSPPLARPPPDPPPSIPPLRPAPVPVADSLQPQSFTGAGSPRPGGGVFSISCTLDDQAKDDPIVFFGLPARNPLSSTRSSGRAASTLSRPLTVRPTSGTTCGDSGDTAAYGGTLRDGPGWNPPI